MKTIAIISENILKATSFIKLLQVKFPDNIIPIMCDAPNLPVIEGQYITMLLESCVCYGIIAKLKHNIKLVRPIKNCCFLTINNPLVYYFLGVLNNEPINPFYTHSINLTKISDYNIIIDNENTTLSKLLSIHKEKLGQIIYTHSPDEVIQLLLDSRK